MKPPTRPAPEPSLPGTVGTVRADRRLPRVLAKLTRGDIVVLSHLDIDTATARVLLDHQPLVVLNSMPFISGRFANLGPQLLLDGGVELIEIEPGQGGSLVDGAVLRLHEHTLFDQDVEVVSGRVVTAAEVAQRMEQARGDLVTQLESFTHNAAEYLRREEDMLLHGLGSAQLTTPVQGRPVVVVGAGADREDLRNLRRYIREERPVLIGVDGGAEDLLALHLRPHVVVVSEEALTGAKDGAPRLSERVLTLAGEVVLHAGRSGAGPGLQRLERLGIRAESFTSAGNTADVAMLLAHQAGAKLLIPVGTPASLAEFIDRSGQASTFLTRLTLGDKVVEATAVPQLYAGRVRLWHLAVILLAAAIALLIAVDTTQVGHRWLHPSSDTVASVPVITSRTASP